MSAPVAQMSPELDVLTKLSNEELKERVTAMAGASPAFAAWLEAQEWPVPAAAVAAPVAPKANGMVTPWADIVPGTDAQRLSDASAAKTVLTLCKGGTLCTRLAVAEAADAEPLRRGFLSHVSYVMDDEGFPCFPLADSLAAVNVRDTKKADGLAPASFFVHGTASTTLLGDVESFDVSTLSEYQLTGHCANTTLVDSQSAQGSSALPAEADVSYGHGSGQLVEVGTNPDVSRQRAMDVWHQFLHSSQ